LNRSISAFISLASLPCTGTGKNRSIAVGLAACAVPANAAAAGIANAPPMARRRVIGCIPALFI
jgi:hypothetical protein